MPADRHFTRSGPRRFSRRDGTQAGHQTHEFFPSFREGGSNSFQEEIERVLLSTHNTDQSFNYVYWVEPDLTQHMHGTKSDEVGKVVKALNKDVEDLFQHVTDDTLVVLIADHGLIDVEEVLFFYFFSLLCGRENTV